MFAMLMSVTFGTFQPPPAQASTLMPNYPGSDLWDLTFEEQFEGTALDSSRWTIRDKDQYSYHDKTYVSVSDGNLNQQVSVTFMTGATSTSAQIYLYKSGERERGRLILIMFE